MGLKYAIIKFSASEITKITSDERLKIGSKNKKSTGGFKIVKIA